MTTPTINPYHPINQQYTLVIRKKPGKLALLAQKILGTGIAFFQWATGFKADQINFSENFEKIGAKTLNIKGESGNPIFSQHISGKDVKQMIEQHFQIDKIKNDSGLYFKLTPKDGSEETKNLYKTLQSLGFRKQPNDKNHPLLTINRFHETPRGKRSTENPTVIFGYGLGFSPPRHEVMSYLMHEIDVMIYHAPSIGLSEGKFRSDLYKEGADACFDYLADKGIKEEEILVEGSCLSGGLAAHLASNHPEVNVMLIHTASHSRNTYSPIIPWPLKGLVKKIMGVFHVETKEYAKKIKGNVLIVKDLKDEVVPPQDSDEIYHSVPETAGKVKKLIETNVGHLGCWKGQARPRSEYSDFLREIGFIG